MICLTRKIVGFCAIGLAAISLCLLFISTASANDTTYYVNNQAGSNCNNAGTGTSESAPWCDFTPVNSHSPYGPGDKILLARGATWNQQMTVTGSGTAANKIELGAYGTGNRPIVTRNSNESDRAIKITNPDYWYIHDLEVKNAGSGIYVYFNTTNHNGLYFDNIYVHNITGIHQGSGSGSADAIWNSAGIQITGNVTLTSPASYVLRTLRMDRIEGTNNFNSISLDFDNSGSSGAINASGGATRANNVLQDVIINHAYLHDDNNSAAGCDEGMRFDNTNGGILMNSVIDNEASCHSNTGTAAIFMAHVKDIKFINNIITNTPNTSSPDMVAVDFECCTDSVKFYNNYIANHAGAGLSNLAIWNGGWGTNDEYSGNMFVNNGNGSIRRAGAEYVPTGTIQDNLFNEPAQFLYQEGADFSGFTITNNLSISSSSLVYNAAAQFSAIQNIGGSNCTAGSNCWSYEYDNGTNWTKFGFYDFANKTWRPSSQDVFPHIAQFEQYPDEDSNVTVARAWTAPSKGTISIRGRVLKSIIGGGDGVVARITKNGTPIWPAVGDQTITYNDLTGVAQVLDNISVDAGDVIRFEVNSGMNNDDDMISWAPTIAYTFVDGLWNFVSTTEGWTNGNQISQSVSAGINTLTSSGGDPFIYSPDNLNFNASTYKYVKVKLKNNTSDTYSEVFFTTTTDTSWTQAKSAFATITAYDSGYTEYIFDFSGVSGWTGSIKQLRFDPVRVSGTVEVDSIQLSETGESSAYHWGFVSTTEGWTNGNQINQSVFAGINTLTSGGGDPYIYSSDNLNANASTYKYVKIKLKNNTSDTYSEVFFTTTTDTSWTEAKSAAVTITANDSGYTEYIFDFSGVSGWTGSIKQLRFDPVRVSGTVEVDYIRLSNTGS